MTSSAQAAPVAFELDDDAYWAGVPVEALDALDPGLISTRFDGVVVGAPKQVRLSDRATLPLAVLRAGTCLQVYDLSMEEHARVVAMDLRQNRLRVANANSDDDLDRPGRDELDEGYSTELHMLDLRDLLELPWRPGRYRVWVLLGERLSDAHDVELVAGRFQDEAVEAFVDEQLRQARLQQGISPLPADPVPNYDRSPETPPAVTELGLALTADRVVVATPEGRCVVRGAFRLPVEHYEQYVPPEEGEPYDPAPAAIVRISLLVVGANDLRSGVVEVQCPVYGALTQDGDQLVGEGQFAVDIMSHLGGKAQTYFVYAFARQFQAGPALTGLVEPERLEP